MVTIAKALTGETGTQTGIAEAGEDLTYTITLSNTGGTAVTRGIRRDRSAGCEHDVRERDNGGTEPRGIVTWTGSEIVPANGSWC